MHTGSIKFFNAGKGFGFITPDGGDTDIFLPAAALTTSGLQSVKQGQRVTFEQAPDTKGPKVTALKLLDDVTARAPLPAPDRLSVYCDPASDIAADVLNELRSAGHQLRLHDYVGTPLTMEQLRRLSGMLSEAGQSLVRRYDPLFLALQLDDRFITDQDFWTGIAEHPTLINGPVLLQSGRARICRSAEDVRVFLNKSAPTVPGPKSLSPRVTAMLKGETVPVTVSVAPASGKKDVAPAASLPAPAALPKSAKSMPAPKMPAPKPPIKVAVKPKPKAAAKPPTPEKKTEKKVEKKAAAKNPVKPVKKAKKPSRK